MFSSLVQLFLLALISIVTVDGFTYKINSIDASDKQFTFMASIRVTGKHLCGGAIIGKRYILTAGHCVAEAKRVNISDVTVLTGTIFVNDGSSGTTSTVDSMYNAYGNGQISDTDIGLIKLTKDLTWNSTTNAISLSEIVPDAGKYGTMVGWGSRYSNNVPIPNDRMQYQLVYIADDCTPYQTTATRTCTTASIICTNNGPSTGACYGDSGNPLIYKDNVVGVVSRAVLCGTGFSDVYSRVSENLGFIKDIMKE
nr:chymotrypsin-2-like [Megalopta genalis]